MENHLQPFSGSFAQHDQYNANVNGLPLVAGQNSHGLRGAEHDLDASRLPLVDGEIPENTQSQYDPNADDVAPNSPPIAAENFHADSSTDMASIIDQIMGRAPPAVFTFSDTSGFQADAYMNAATPPLFVPPEPNTTFMNNMPPNGNFNTLMDSQTQTAPLYDATQGTANGINGSGQSPPFSSNYFFPVNEMMQQPSIFASNPSPNWQGTAPGNQFGQYSAPPAMFTPQAYNSFPQAGSSTALIRPQQPSPGNQYVNVNPITPGTSLPMLPQFNSPNISSVMPSTSLPMMSHFNSLHTSSGILDSSQSGSIAFNPMNTNSMMPGTYSLPVSNAMPGASFGNPGRRVTFGPGMSARIELGYNTFTSSAPHSSPSKGSSSSASTGANSREIQNQILGSASSAHAGREIKRQDGLDTHASAAASQQANSRVETYQQMNYDGPLFNKVYDPRYAELGLPVDPFLRMFNQHPEFWKKMNGTVELTKK